MLASWERGEGEEEGQSLREGKRGEGEEGVLCGFLGLEVGEEGERSLRLNFLLPIVH